MCQEGGAMKKPIYIIICIFGFLFFAMALDAQTWEKTKRLTWNWNASYYPAISVDSSSKIHLVWQDYTPGNAEIHYKRSTNEGITWGSSKRLT